MTKLRKNLIAFHTKINTRSDEILVEQKAETKNKMEELGKIVDLSVELKKSLNENNINNFGNILNKGWIIKKTLASNMTNTYIDKYYDLAMKAGAQGGKILGSGGGGFLLFYCDYAFVTK